MSANLANKHRSVISLPTSGARRVINYTQKKNSRTLNTLNLPFTIFFNYLQNRSYRFFDTSNCSIIRRWFSVYHKYLKPASVHRLRILRSILTMMNSQCIATKTGGLCIVHYISHIHQSTPPYHFQVLNIFKQCLRPKYSVSETLATTSHVININQQTDFLNTDGPDV